VRLGSQVVILCGFACLKGVPTTCYNETEATRKQYFVEVISESHFTLHIQFREGESVHDYIKERTIKIGKYIVETRKTVRVIAKEFGVSKSTVHKDLTERLPEINPELANEVKEILDYHKSIRHLRGGEATKMKYQKEEKQGETIQK
jgi:putative DeoR family transcriptional regulator, stage III sporulation protein D